jgi:hypothetical protein
MPRLCELCDETRKLKSGIPRCRNRATRTVTGTFLGRPTKLRICDAHFGREVGKAVTGGGYDRLRKLAHDALGALLWCGAAADFSPGGPAQRGWDRGPAKVIKKLHAELEGRGL